MLGVSVSEAAVDAGVTFSMPSRTYSSILYTLLTNELGYYQQPTLSAFAKEISLVSWSLLLENPIYENEKHNIYSVEIS